MLPAIGSDARRALLRRVLASRPSRGEDGQHVFLLADPLTSVPEHRQALIGRHRSGKQKSLAHRAAQFSQYFGLLVALDAFGDHLDVQVPRDGDDGAHDRQIARIGHEVADEAAVDFQRVDPPILEVAQARVTGSKIIDRDLDTEIAQACHRILPVLP